LIVGTAELEVTGLEFELRVAGGRGCALLVLRNKPKSRLALRLGLAAQCAAPGCESIQPPPVTNPPLGSYTTTYCYSAEPIGVSLPSLISSKIV
jgi:hypothetical protein